MKARARIALALSMLLLLASVASVDAANPNLSTVPSIFVGSWSYCRVDTTHDMIRANNVTVSGLRKYTYDFSVNDGEWFAPAKIGRKSVALQWTFDPSTYNAGDSIGVMIYASTSTWSPAAQLPGARVFKAGTYEGTCP